MERQLCAGNRDDLGNLLGAGMWQPRDPRGAPAGASPRGPHNTAVATDRDSTAAFIAAPTREANNF